MDGDQVSPNGSSIPVHVHIVASEKVLGGFEAAKASGEAVRDVPRSHGNRTVGANHLDVRGQYLAKVRVVEMLLVHGAKERVDFSDDKRRTNEHTR